MSIDESRHGYCVTHTGPMTATVLAGMMDKMARGLRESEHRECEVIELSLESEYSVDHRGIRSVLDVFVRTRVGVEA